MDRIRQLQVSLRDNPHLTKVLGLVDVLDFFDSGATGTVSRLLDRMSSVLGTPTGMEAKLSVLNRQRPDVVPAFWHADQKIMRVMLRAREQAPSDVKESLIEFVAETARRQLAQSPPPE
jgi:hypothetical protein